MTTTMLADAPFREAEFMPVDLDVERRADGTIILKSRVPLRAFDANIPRAFAERAALKGDTPAIGWRGTDAQWAYRSYTQIKRDMDGATRWLAENFPRGTRLLIIAENSLPVAVMTFAAWAAGMIIVPVSIAYGLAGGDHTRLRHVIARTQPDVILAEPHPAIAAALAATAPGARIVSSDPAPFADASAYADVISTDPGAFANEAIAAVDPAAPAIYMLTSGSTGLPKIVPHSLTALAACGAQGLDMIGKAAGWDDVMLDWLPWHHAAGASVMRTCLLEGGTLHIDAGKPLPGLFDQTIANLREISVSYFNNVPTGYAMLVEAMEHDAELRARFFAKMRLMLYGGAGLPQPVYDRLQELAIAETGHRIHMTTGYGMTETVSGCMAIHFPATRVGIGLPAPGLSLKLVPCDGRYEVRLAGPNVMKGYLDEPEKTAAAFDDEGYYRTGDVAVFHDENDYGQGLAFAGRLAEEFKLANGNWVYGGAVREKLLKACDGLIADLVLADDGRPYLAMLAWPKPGATLDTVAEAVRGYNREARGGAVIRRVALFDTPPNPGAHELSDKGTINRRAVLDGRREWVERVFADPPDEGVAITG
jgi:feruloyl-CoA synthase